MKRPMLSALFVFAAIYDGFFGLVFLTSAGAIFERFGVTPPNHVGYVQFPAALLVIFALMFFAIAMNPERNRNLIPYGMLLKVAYCAIVFWHWAAGGIPNMWKPLAFCDLVFLVLFALAYRATGGAAETVCACDSSDVKRDA